MDLKKYWSEKHKKYSLSDWIKKPTYFSKFVIDYFPPSGKLLDLGCGQGQDSVYFAKKGYLVTATEFSEEAISYAKETWSKDLNIDYIIHDLKDSFPFKDNNFDIVYSHLSVQFFDDKQMYKIASEIYRVLKTGGILAIMVNTQDDPEMMNSRKMYNDLYLAPDGLVKRFFTKESLQKFFNDKFETLLTDSKGKTYKDDIKNLIRLIARVKK